MQNSSASMLKIQNSIKHKTHQESKIKVIFCMIFYSSPSIKEIKTFHIWPVFGNLNRSWPLYSHFMTLDSTLLRPNDYSISLHYLITAAQADPAGRCEGNHSQMCTSDRACDAQLKGVSCRAEAIDAACLLLIFKFSAPYGIRSVTSSKPLLRLMLCSLLKPKKPTSWSNPLFLQQSSVVNKENVLQTASHEYKPSWQQKASALLRCPWIFWILTSCNGCH